MFLCEKFCFFLEDTYVDYMKSELSVDEEPLQGVDISSGFSVGSSLEGAWLLGDSNVSYPCFPAECECKIVNKCSKCSVKEEDIAIRKLY